MFQPVDRLMRQGLLEGVFPGAVLLISRIGRVLFLESYGYAHPGRAVRMTRETVFDLASLTKPLATTLAVMKLVQDHRLSLDQSLAATLPAFRNTEKAGITPRHLLAHRSGLPAHRPYFLQMQAGPGAERKDALRRMLVEEPLENPVGEKTVYSDLGFMILGWVVEAVSGRPLDRFVAGEVYRPLGLDDLFFIGTGPAPPGKDFAATECCPWRKVLLEGVVHDENAYAQGGIAGHAGLFGTAAAVHMLLGDLEAAYQGRCPGGVFRKEVLDQFFRYDPTWARPLGFDAPSQSDASCGRHFSPGSVGHLGFTGTSFWMDLVRSVHVILLTNRVHPSRENEKIKAFRPGLHDMIMEILIGAG